VLSFAVSFGQTGSFVQDIATADVLRRLSRRYLDECGFADVRLYLVYHQWMGAFPPQRPKASALISSGAMIATLINADKVVVKTVDEALGVPRPEVNAEAVDTVQYVMRILRGAEAITSPVVQSEADLITAEVQSVVNAIFELSGGAFWESVFRAFQLGYLDVPFAPHADNANRLISMRDANGSIRIREPGNVPISDRAAALERSLLQSRAGQDDKTYRQLLADINLMVEQ